MYSDVIVTIMQYERFLRKNYTNTNVSVRHMPLYDSPVELQRSLGRIFIRIIVLAAQLFGFETYMRLNTCTIYNL